MTTSASARPADGDPDLNAAEAPLTANEVKHDQGSRLDHIRWLGGGTGAGKTTVAHLLSERTGAQIYSTDEAIATHAAQLGARDAPLLDEFRRMSMEERGSNATRPRCTARSRGFTVRASNCC